MARYTPGYGPGMTPPARAPRVPALDRIAGAEIDAATIVGEIDAAASIAFNTNALSLAAPAVVPTIPDPVSLVLVRGDGQSGTATIRSSVVFPANASVTLAQWLAASVWTQDGTTELPSLTWDLGVEEHGDAGWRRMAGGVRAAYLGGGGLAVQATWAAPGDAIAVQVRFDRPRTLTATRPAYAETDVRPQIVISTTDATKLRLNAPTATPRFDSDVIQRVLAGDVAWLNSGTLTVPGTGYRVGWVGVAVNAAGSLGAYVLSTAGSASTLADAGIQNTGGAWSDTAAAAFPGYQPIASVYVYLAAGAPAPVTLGGGSASALTATGVTVTTSDGTYKPLALTNFVIPGLALPADLTALGAWRDTLFPGGPRLVTRADLTALGGAYAQMASTLTTGLPRLWRQYGMFWPRTGGGTIYGPAMLFLEWYAMTGERRWVWMALQVAQDLRERGRVIPNNARFWGLTEVHACPDTPACAYALTHDPVQRTALIDTTYRGEREAERYVLSALGNDGRWFGRGCAGLAWFGPLGITDPSPNVASAGELTNIGLGTAVPSWSTVTTNAERVSRLVAALRANQVLSGSAQGRIWFGDPSGAQPFMQGYILSNVLRCRRVYGEALSLKSGGVPISRDVYRDATRYLLQATVEGTRTGDHPGLTASGTPLFLRGPRLLSSAIDFLAYDEGDARNGVPYGGGEQIELNGNQHLILAELIGDATLDASERAGYWRVARRFFDSYPESDLVQDLNAAPKMYSEAFLYGWEWARLARDGAPAAVAALAGTGLRPNLFAPGHRTAVGMPPYSVAPTSLVDVLGNEVAGLGTPTYDSGTPSVATVSAAGLVTPVAPGSTTIVVTPAKGSPYLHVCRVLAAAAADDFEDGVLDPTRWTDESTGGASVTEVGGELRFTLGAGAVGEARVVLLGGPWDAREASAMARHLRAHIGATVGDHWLYVDVTSGAAGARAGMRFFLSAGRSTRAPFSGGLPPAPPTDALDAIAAGMLFEAVAAEPSPAPTGKRSIGARLSADGGLSVSTGFPILRSASSATGVDFSALSIAIGLLPRAGGSTGALTTTLRAVALTGP